MEKDNMYTSLKISETLSPISAIEESIWWNPWDWKCVKTLVGHEVYDRVKEIITIFGKAQKKDVSEKNI